MSGTETKALSLIYITQYLYHDGPITIQLIPLYLF
jgi:hypothetical protein